MKSAISAWIDPRATVPALVIGEYRSASGWRSNGRPTGLRWMPIRGKRILPAQLRETTGPIGPPSDLRGRWSVRAVRDDRKLQLVIRRRFGRATLTIRGTAFAVDAPWSWDWTVQRIAQPETTGTAPEGTDWPMVCRAALRDVYDLEKQTCASENLTRRGQGTATAAALGNPQTTPARPARAELAPEPAPAPRPPQIEAAPTPAPRKRNGAKLGAKQVGLFGG